MKFHIAILLMLAGLHHLMAAAEDSASMNTLAPGDHALTFVSSYDKSTQPYRLYLPQVIKSSQPLPLVIVLHGKYVDQNAWFDYTPIKEAAEKHGYIAAAPHSRGNWFYRGPGEQDVFDIVELLKSQYKIDEDRVYLMGHSMGGWGTWWLAARRPDVWATICPMAAMPPIEYMENAGALDPLIIHSRDDDVVSIRNSHVSVHALLRQGASFRFIEENGYGHSSQMIGDNFDRIFAWFAEHRRVPEPKEIHYITRRVPSGAWWVKVLELNKPSQRAEIQAEWKSGNVLQIKVENVSRFAILADGLPEDIQWPILLSVNNAVKTLEKFSGAAEISEIYSHNKFHLEIKPAAALKPKSSPVIGTLADDFPTTDSGLPHVAPVAAILLRESQNPWGLGENKVEYALLHRDMFRLPAGKEITEAEALDLYLYADNSFGTFGMTGAELIEMEKSQSALFNIEPLSPKPDPEKIYQVVGPSFIAARHNLYFTELPRKIDEYICDYIRQSGQWP